jgi:hypothetical protein
MFRVSYTVNNTIAHKGGFRTESEARAWIEAQGMTIKPLKLLIWDNDINCFSTVEEFTKRGNASATAFYKRVFA